MSELMARRANLFDSESVRAVMEQAWTNSVNKNDFFEWTYLAKYYGSEIEAERLIQQFREG
ncbi:MAG: hypothetical protein ACI9DF_005667 [Verrucomicrobiales bacterium]|jgi:hypothetical protein